MLLEIHCHTSTHSKCSQVDPVALVRQVVKKQLQGVIITEHHYLWPEEELLRLRREAEVNDSFIILSGQEVETDIGHVVVFGAGSSIEKPLSLDVLRRDFPEAALVWAHPFRSGKIPTDKALCDARLDAVEIFSSNHTPKENYLGLAMWHKHKFTAVSGTDTHAMITAGILPTQFDHPVKSIAEAVAEIKNGRCRPFFKEIPKSGSNIVVTEITLGTKGEDEMRDRIILKEFSDEKKWEKMRETLEVTKKIYEKAFADGAYRIPRILDVNEGERLVIEEGQRGKNLFELLENVSPAAGAEYFRMAARWLAKFHNSGCCTGAGGETHDREKKRMKGYLRSFADTKSPYLDDAKKLIDLISAGEDKMFSAGTERLVLCHGDYHPKNIIIGQDKTHDISTLFISVIDFGSVISAPRAFDVGYFLSQFRSQFRANERISQAYAEEDFLSAYLADCAGVEKDAFRGEVEFFKIRANLSIASFLIKVGKGTSPEMRDVMSRSIAAASELYS